MKGTVKFFNAKRGYGFIHGEDEKDYFVHQSDINIPGFRKLSKNNSVNFEPSINEKGLIAANVAPV